jgi:2-succinyl-6-hydroxy-2,4-cyclohexadiene-1-carboxylate synthase
VLHPAPGQLVHERLDRSEGAVDWDHGAVSAEVVFVPGFMQRGAAWERVAREVGERYPVRCLDFSTWTFEERVAELLEAAPPGSAVAGYSLGGRIALHAAVREPARFAALALVGATPGLEDPGERERRVAADDELAAWMAQATIEQVVERWEGLPVFTGQPEELVAAQRPGRLSHDPKRLAALLRSASPGRLPHLWGRLPEVPLLAIGGERDERYTAIARRMGPARVVPRAGHAAQLEQPAAVAALLLDFLDEHLGDRAVVDRHA